MKKHAYIIIFIGGVFLTSVNAGPFDDIMKDLEEIGKELGGTTIDSNQNKDPEVDSNQNKDPEVETDKNQIPKVTDRKQNSTSIELPLNEPGVAFQCTLKTIIGMNDYPPHPSEKSYWDFIESPEAKSLNVHRPIEEITNIQAQEKSKMSYGESIMYPVNVEPATPKYTSEIGSFKTYFVINLEDSSVKHFVNSAIGTGERTTSDHDKLLIKHGVEFRTSEFMSTRVLGDDYPGRWSRTSSINEENPTDGPFVCDMWKPIDIQDSIIEWGAITGPSGKGCGYTHRFYLNRETLDLVSAGFYDYWDDSWKESCQILSIEELNVSLKEEVRIKTDELAARANEITKRKTAKLSKRKF